MPTWKKGQKLGARKFQNLAISGVAPAGQRLKVTIKDGKSPVYANNESRTMEFAEVLWYLPQTDDVVFEFKPTISQMRKATVTFVGNARSYDDHWLGVIEHRHYFGTRRCGNHCPPGGPAIH